MLHPLTLVNNMKIEYRIEMNQSITMKIEQGRGEAKLYHVKS